ncbi:unnamed protein product [Closterium sp. NIES-65]|nr:unnamed protein product [Closterium sp. NIES-65]
MSYKSDTNFTCVCRPGYSALDSGNGCTCAVVKAGSSVSSLSTGAIVGIAVGCFAGFVLLAAMLSCLLWPRGPRKWEGLDVCEQYTLQQMVKATDNWAKGNVLGKGAFCIVYKGCLPQGQTWAIKRSTVMTNDFEMEVRAIESLHHVNLVRLMGFCQDLNVETGNQEQILVYEFVANGDLQHHIYRSESESQYATKMVEDYQVIGMKDTKLDATEEAVLAIVDLALDCIKSPGARRPVMKDIAYRLTALIDKYCSDKQSEVEEVTGKAVDEIPSDSSVGTGTISQTSTMSLGSFIKGMGSWLEKRPS